MKVALGLTMLAVSSTCLADDDFQFSANTALTSNYVFRGVSLSQDEAAIQGGFDVNHKSGAYAGIWGSSDSGNGELDFYLGYGFEVNDLISLDIGAVRYTYNGAGKSTNEFHIGADISFINLVYHYDETLKTHYIEANTSYEINQRFSADFHLGSVDGDNSSSNYDYSVTLNYQINDRFASYITYSDNEADTKYADSTVFVGLTAEF